MCQSSINYRFGTTSVFNRIGRSGMIIVDTTTKLINMMRNTMDNVSSISLVSGDEKNDITDEVYEDVREMLTDDLMDSSTIKVRNTCRYFVRKTLCYYLYYLYFSIYTHLQVLCEIASHKDSPQKDPNDGLNFDAYDDEVDGFMAAYTRTKELLHSYLADISVKGKQKMY